MAPTLRDELLDSARRAACAVAAELGLAVEPPELIAFASNVILRLPPHDLVARVSGESAEIRAADGGQAREIAVTRFLAASGAPVVAPSDLIDPGPHTRYGLTITFWALVPDEGAHNGVGDGAPKSALEVLDTLGKCRAALAGWSDPLLYMKGYNEARQVFQDLLRTNMLGTIDPADTVRRLAVIDAARAGDEAALMAALPGDVDSALLATMIDARNLQRAVWDTAIRALNRSDIARQNVFVRGARFLRRRLRPDSGACVTAPIRCRRQLQRMSNGRRTGPRVEWRLENAAMCSSVPPTPHLGLFMCRAFTPCTFFLPEPVLGL